MSKAKCQLPTANLHWFKSLSLSAAILLLLTFCASREKGESEIHYRANTRRGGRRKTCTLIQTGPGKGIETVVCTPDELLLLLLLREEWHLSGDRQTLFIWSRKIVRAN